MQSISAEHIVVERKDELNSISGSKYLQSNPYMGLKNILKEKSGVIFGTPCQIAGVRNILNLYKVKKFFFLLIFFVMEFHRSFFGIIIWNF